VMYLLEQRLKNDKSYLTIDISFEGIDSPTYENHHLFISTILHILRRRLEFLQETELADLVSSHETIESFDKLNAFFTDFVLKAGRKVVLMIDEVDKAGNNQLFLDFLGMLRTKYLRRNEGKDHSFYSVILAGVHDIKTLKAKLRPEEKRLYNSPWNIAVDFKVDLSLSANEIMSMLEDYVADRQVIVDIPYFSEKIFYYTSGYPFLVSYLCKIIDEDILPAKSEKKWTPDDLIRALQIGLAGDTSNFDTLIKNLEHKPELYEFVFKIIMNGQEFQYNRHNKIIKFGTIYGILRDEKGKVKIHNRFYEQLIYNYMASNLETSGNVELHPVSSSYIEKTGTLNIKKAIKKFQQFVKEQYSSKDVDFIERNGRLLFLAFIKPIINGKGFDFKEVQISEEKRLDIVVTFLDQKYIIELKVWRGESYHQEGIKQLCDYLDRQNQTKGYLLVFDLRKEKKKTGDSEQINAYGKSIYVAWI